MFQIDLTGIEIGELLKTSKESPVKIALDILFSKETFIAEMTSLLMPLDNLGVFD